MHYKKYLLLLLLVGVGCIDTIEFDRPDIQRSDWVLQGKLVLGDLSHISLRIDRLDGLDDRVFTLPIPVSEAYIENDRDQRVNLEYQQDGWFEKWIGPNDGFSVQEGLEYRMTVIVDGEQIQSEWEPLLPVPKVERIDVQIEERSVLNEAGNSLNRLFVQYLVTSENGQTEYGNTLYRWILNGSFRVDELLSPADIPPPVHTCYVKETISQSTIPLLNGNSAQGVSIQGFQIGEQVVDHRFSKDYYVSVIQESLSPTAFDYWQKVSSVLDRTGSILETPPGILPTNWNHSATNDQNIIGIFYAVAQDTFHRRIDPREVGGPNAFCTAWASSYGEAPERCKDCLLYANSSYEKPSFWE